MTRAKCRAGGGCIHDLGAGSWREVSQSTGTSRSRERKPLNQGSTAPSGWVGTSQMGLRWNQKAWSAKLASGAAQCHSLSTSAFVGVKIEAWKGEFESLLSEAALQVKDKVGPCYFPWLRDHECPDLRGP